VIIFLFFSSKGFSHPSALVASNPRWCRSPSETDRAGRARRVDFRKDHLLPSSRFTSRCRLKSKTFEG
jgi:hypothetical protein